jgi:hypothetical protein
MAQRFQRCDKTSRRDLGFAPEALLGPFQQYHPPVEKSSILSERKAYDSFHPEVKQDG